MPSANYTTGVLQAWREILAREFNGTASEYSVQISSESLLTRVQVTVWTQSGGVAAFHIPTIERLLAQAIPSDDRLAYRDELDIPLDEAQQEEIYAMHVEITAMIDQLKKARGELEAKVSTNPLTHFEVTR